MARSRALRPPAHLWTPSFTSTNGDLAADMGAQVGLVPDAEQRLILDAMFAESRPGVPVCFECAVIAPRQNLKTAVFQIAALTDLFLLEEELVVWTAHLFKTAKAAFEGLVKLIDTTPHLASQCRPHRTANGDEAIELKTGQRIEFHARSKGGGRGLTGSKVILDEALFLSPSEVGALLPTLATVESAQVRYASSAGLLASDVLRGIRNRGHAGGEDRLFYAEWCAPRVECGDEMCAHLLGTPGCALDRVDLRKAANPAYARRISAEMLEQFRRAMPPEEFMREFLGWWDDPPVEGEKAIKPEAWKSCLDYASTFGPGPTALGLHYSADRALAFVGAAGEREDGRTHVEILAAVSPTAVIGKLLELDARRRAPVVLDPGSHAGSLITDLEAAGFEVIPITLQKLAQACGMTIDAVADDTLRHIGQPQLDVAVRNAGVRITSRDAWAWDGPATAPLSAITLALHGFAVGDAHTIDDIA